MNKKQSLIKKIKNVNIHALIKGMIAKGTGDMEDVAEIRAAVCAECPSNIHEPIEAIAVTDRIESIDRRMCEECGCSLPYKVRQLDEGCPLKKW